MDGMPGPLRYATSQGFSIAWQEFGTGPVEIGFVWGMPNHIESLWEWPSLASFLRGVGRLGRVVHLDQRGTGLSDRVAVADLPDLSDRSADVLAVLDAANMDRVTLIGESEGATSAVRLAAEHPERVDRLVLLAPTLRGLIPDEIREEMLELIESNWGGPLMVELAFPTHTDDPRFVEWYSRFLRLSASPGEARALIGMDQEIDEWSTLARVDVPTLLLAHSDDPWVSLDAHREAVARLPNGSLVVIDGATRTFGTGPGDVEALEAIAMFLDQDSVVLEDHDRHGRAVLFTDIVGSTSQLVGVGDAAWRTLLDVHDRIMHRLVADHGGDWVGHTGDGVAATFVDANGAVNVAKFARRSLAEHGLDIRAGVHTGHVEKRGNEIAGLDVHIAARIADLAGSGEVLVSDSTAALLDRDVGLTPLGTYELKGVPGSWRLSRVG